jgi:hypothetical protein
MPVAPASLPSGLVVVEAPCPPAPAEPGTWLPAVGGSMVVVFLGQPARSPAAANKQAIDTILFIEFPIGFFLKT